MAKVQKIIETVEQALFLSFFPRFYFVMYLDFRTRTFYHGWPFNPQGDVLVRELLMFSDEEEKTSKELDVSASGVQIIGGLLANRTYLERTNLVKKKGHILGKKVDLYDETLSNYFNEREVTEETPNVKNFFTRKVF